MSDVGENGASNSGVTNNCRYKVIIGESDRGP